MTLTLLVGVLNVASNIQPVESDYTWTETIYIKADGSVYPDTAPISNSDNVTFTLTDNIVGDIPQQLSAIVFEKDSIVFNGAGYSVQGTWTSYSKGISLSERSNVTIKNTHVKKFYYGIYLYGSTNCRIENVTAIDNGYGIVLYWESNQNILSHNNATSNSEGILVYRSNNNNITSNAITDCDTGIDLYDSSNNILSGNIVSSRRYGIELWAYRSYGNILSGNIVSLSGVDGIVLNGAHNNTLFGNIVSSNGQYGITLMADNNIIYGNILINNSRNYWSSGIYIQFHYNNTISSNTIKNNSQGIFLYGSGENNKIFHNNFINNTNQVYVSGEHSNVWDDGYPSGGNYWSDYTGVDSDPDGICDTEYVIDADNIDQYPLMGMFSDFNATSEHNVQTICNSSISDFQYNGTAIYFNVTGDDGTIGFCRTCIPTALMNATYKVYVNGTEISYNLLPCSNETHTYLYFNYTHSTQEVVIIPEFPSFIIMPLFMITTLLAVMIYKRKHSKKLHTQVNYIQVFESCSFEL